ncbi:5-methyltetrahydropteroyltriglutamate-- homocysteine methyltransferase [Rubrobacter xylanophilus DSM 9941]|uniref:cobalamin-independent methionine synthase II family protein n=1 Tax=Rubrobacter xylanophilus TaxID=49319 RepID=UPI001C63B8F2|nr:cobalamin-independent methionine synthase II family protein [Rubrobacter xylanophilus]QYJ17150.1 5-methyltetrahydropteroyltriglutamate-- homocysteine methyltransferase [Rubrobacter xylanophilus DSM 9941]
MLEARADVVGSLLRPPELLQARERYARGELSAADFKRTEDAAVDRAIRLQEEAGLPVVTDGEMRRTSFQSQLVEAVEGFGEVPLEAYLWGEWRGDERVGDRSVERPRGLGVRNRLRARRHLSVEEFVYARARTQRTVKVTLPSPSLYANLWSPEVSREAYPTLDAFLEDVAEVLRREVEELVRLGATYIQLDAPHYPLLLDPRTRRFYEARGWDLDRWLSRGVELDNHVIGDHPGVTFAFHLCRGNQGSRWLVSGSYEPLARRLFRGVRAQRLMLEYDDERSGSFGPLAHLPEDKVAVLGLVTTKSPRRETPEELEARLREASRCVPPERLALSPQCGFATSVMGNAITPADQEYKLRVVAETARRFWG